MIAYITITSFIGSFKAYRTIVGLFGPTVLPAGTLPDESFITIVGLIYESLSKSDTPGMVSEAAAASILLFLTTLIFTFVNMWVSKKRVHF
jgi:multiple sugar transport system permease protein